jgi:hypothetical protein
MLLYLLQLLETPFQVSVFLICLILSLFEVSSNRRQKFAQGLNVFLVWLARIANKPCYAEVHDVFLEHTLKVQLTNEVDVAKHSPFQFHPLLVVCFLCNL